MDNLLIFLAITILADGLTALFAAGLLFVLNRDLGYEYQKYWAISWSCFAIYIFLSGIILITKSTGYTSNLSVAIFTFFSQFAGYTAPIMLYIGVRALKGLPNINRSQWVTGITILAVFSILVTLTFNSPDEFRERYVIRLGLRSVVCAILLIICAIQVLNFFKDKTISGPGIFSYGLLAYSVTFIVYAIASIDIFISATLYRYLAAFGVISYFLQLPIVYGFIIWAVQNEHEKFEGAQQTLRQQAWLDPLTQLHNRRWFEIHGEKKLKHLLSNKKKAAVLFIDLDGFKQVNDTMGHKTGDHLLHKVAQVLKSSMASEDMLCRLGGDEFVMLLSNYDSRERIQITAHKIRKNVQNINLIDGRKISISCSIGISCQPCHTEKQRDLACLTTRSDAAMYSAKSLGKNTIAFDDK